ncbi:MAG: Endoribonuclease YbeY [candidate division BRC1 bacterium ADurb.BinA292]|nr:MAG: Endoribonuclease YbeY [candidate division BRC1 bacterium ADurb.BinA292]
MTPRATPRIVWSLRGRLGRHAQDLGPLGAELLGRLARRAGLDRRHELSLVLCDGPTIRRLNRRWRGHDQPTDVLSFPLHPGDPRRSGVTGAVGDIVVALPVARAAARAEGIDPGRHLARLLAHGLLHLLGYEHDTPARRRSMAAAEDDLLRDEGVEGLIRRSARMP